MRDDLAVVLDIGNSKVACLAAVPNGTHGFTVLAAASVACRGVKRGGVVDLDETSRAIYQVVHQVQQTLKEDVGELIVGISGPSIEGVTGRGLKQIVPRSRQITHQDVLEVVNHSRSIMLPPDREQIQAIPREFRVDGQRDVKQPIGMSGGKLEVTTYIVTGQTSAMQNLERTVTMAGKAVEQMVLRPLGSGIGVLTQEEIDMGAAVVDIGAGMADVAVFVNGSIAYSANLPIGSQHVTSDISKLIKTSLEEAERLKIEAGSAYAKAVPAHETVMVLQLGQDQARSMQRAVLAEIIESRMRELAVMVRQHLEKSGFSAVLPGGVVLTGGGSLLPGTDRVFDETLKHIHVRVGRPMMGPNKPLDPGMAAALGLAQFAIQCFDEIAPASGAKDWKDKVRSLFSMLRPGA